MSATPKFSPEISIGPNGIEPIGPATIRRHACLNDRCVVCGQTNPNGLQLTFTPADDGAVAEWVPTPDWESFQGIIHGGVISAVLDEAMSQAIITRHKEAFTADLRVRFHEKVRIGELLIARGWVVGMRKRMIFAEADLSTCTGAKRARAWGTFLTPKD